MTKELDLPKGGKGNRRSEHVRQTPSTPGTPATPGTPREETSDEDDDDDDEDETGAAAAADNDDDDGDDDNDDDDFYNDNLPVRGGLAFDHDLMQHSDHGFDFQTLKEEASLGYNYHNYLTGKKSMDRLCNFWHVLFLFLGLCLLMLGVLLRFYFGRFLVIYVQSLSSFKTFSSFIKAVDANTEIKFSGLIQDMGVYLIYLNIVYVTCTIGYMLYPVHRISFTLPILCLILNLCCVAEMVIINILSSPAISQDETVMVNLQEQLKNDYRIHGDNDFSISYDYISLWLECCGIVDQFDFRGSKLSLSKSFSEEAKTVQVAPSCCMKSVSNFKGNLGRQKVIECASAAVRGTVLTNGCFTTLTVWLSDACSYYNIVLVVHITDCLLHSYVYHIRITVLEKAVRQRYGVSLRYKGVD